MQLPASPMPFSSNNINILGSSVLDGSNTIQPQQQEQQQQGASNVISLPVPQTGQVSIPVNSNNTSHVDKRPSLDIKPDDTMQQQVLQQLLQRQDPVARNPQLQALLQLGASNATSLAIPQMGQASIPLNFNDRLRLDIKAEDHMQQQVLQQLLQRQDPMARNPQLQALLQQQRLRQQQQQQQLLQSTSPLQRIQFQQQQLKQQFQHQGLQHNPANAHSYESGVCARRVMQYLYHQQQRPPENSITYWRKFVAEYYSPRAKQRLCLSQYDSSGQHAVGMFPRSATDTWHCDLCGCMSGKGFEATFEILARLLEIKFSSGVLDEFLYLDYPRESRLPTGQMILEYRKAVQETVHEHLRIIREGQLRIIFTQDLKILYWEYCVRRHEELLPRKLIAPQVNQLLQAAQKCQKTISESGSEGVSQQDLQTNSNMVLTAGRQLAKCFESQSLNDLGFPKRCIRALQIAEVVTSMTDLIHFDQDHKIGPTEGLKKLSEQAVAAKLQRQQMQEMEQLANVPNNPMALPPGIRNNPVNPNNNHQTIGQGALSGSAQNALALTNYQSIFMKQNPVNHPTPDNVHQEASSSSFPSSNLNPNPIISSSSLQRQNLPVGGSSNPHLFPQLHQQLQNCSNLLPQNHHSQSSQGNNTQALQQQMIQQLLQGISNKNNNTGVVQQQTVSAQNGNCSNVERSGNPAASNASGIGGAGPAPPSRNNSFKAVSNVDNQRGQDVPQNLQEPEDILVPEMPQDFADNGIFSDVDLYGL